jgi:uncharacterized protein (DUF1015 family)
LAILQPFRGLRYDPATVGDLAAVVAPPYDVIDAVQQAALHERSPYNAVRLILSRDADPYGAAAATLAAWRRTGVLAPDPLPALYLYEQRFALAGGERERIGIMGALRLESLQSGRVRAHERTLEKAKNDRLALVRACRTSLSPIFGLVASPAARLRELVPAAPAEVDVRDAHGAHHRLWPITDPASLARVAAELAERDVFIADGHHRYETALRYRDERRAALGDAAPPPGAAPFDYVLTYLTSMDDPGLIILPTHRVLGVLPLDAAALRAALATTFTVAELPASRAGLAALLERLQGSATAAGETRIGAAVAGVGALWLLSAPTARLPFPAGVPPELRVLEVSALHQVILAGMLRLPIGERGGTPGLSYTQDAGAALARVESGEAAAFFLPPTDVAALRAVALAGLTMPEKSTYFHPKLLTGLVFYPLEVAAETLGPAATSAAPRATTS